MGTQTQQQRKTLRERGISSFPLSFPHSLKFYTSVCGTTGRDFSDLNHNIWVDTSYEFGHNSLVQTYWFIQSKRMNFSQTALSLQVRKCDFSKDWSHNWIWVTWVGILHKRPILLSFPSFSSSSEWAKVGIRKGDGRNRLLRSPSPPPEFEKSRHSIIRQSDLIASPSLPLPSTIADRLWFQLPAPILRTRWTVLRELWLNTAECNVAGILT